MIGGYLLMQCVCLRLFLPTSSSVTFSSSCYQSHGSTRRPSRWRNIAGICLLPLRASMEERTTYGVNGCTLCKYYLDTSGCLHALQRHRLCNFKTRRWIRLPNGWDDRLTDWLIPKWNWAFVWKAGLERKWNVLRILSREKNWTWTNLHHNLSACVFPLSTR